MARTADLWERLTTDTPLVVHCQLVSVIESPLSPVIGAATRTGCFQALGILSRGEIKDRTDCKVAKLILFKAMP